MRVVFRVDASVAIGIGHVMRCRTLAVALKERGAHIQFITRAHLGHLGDMLASAGFVVTLLPPPVDIMSGSNDYAVWLGVSQQEDANQTIAALKDQPCDWVIVDHYGLDKFWESQVQLHTHKIMVIDDLANRPHDCDVLLDQNFALTYLQRYQNWVPAHCQLLLGPRYAMLRPEYIQHRRSMSPRSSAIFRVLVFLGGADNANNTSKIILALSADPLMHLEVDIVIGPNYIHKAEVIKHSKARENTHVYTMRPHLADLMVHADIAIGAGGATTWERFCMGLPSLVISTAENQVQICEDLASLGLIRYLGDANQINVSEIRSALLEEVSSARQLRDVSASNQALVDGLGVNRIVEIIIPTLKANLKLRKANDTDAMTYFEWVNEPMVRSSAINSAPIDYHNHLLWFSERISAVDAWLYVLEASGLPVGQVRFEQYDHEIVIDYSLDALVRGRGWAIELLKKGIEIIDDNGLALIATVKPENVASIATFIRLGFIAQKNNNGDGNCRFKLSFLPSETEELL